MKSFVAICLLLCIFMLFTGCTSSHSSNVVATQPIITSTQTTITTDVVTTQPTIESTQITISTIPTTDSSKTSSITTVSTTMPVALYTTHMSDAGDPYINNFGYQKYSTQTSDCVMKQIFPDIGNNPNYGVKANPPYLVGLSLKKFSGYLSDYESGKTAGMSGTMSSVNCDNVPVMESTTWGFEHVYAKFTPRNAKPSEFMIILNIYSDGKLVSQITSNETLTIDQPVEIDTLIPLKGTDTINSVSLHFNRMTGN